MNFQEIDRKKLWQLLGILTVLFLVVWYSVLAPLVAWFFSHWFLSLLVGGSAVYLKKRYLPNQGKINQPPNDYY